MPNTPLAQLMPNACHSHAHSKTNSVHVFNHGAVFSSAHASTITLDYAVQTQALSCNRTSGCTTTPCQTLAGNSAHSPL
eukprot:3908742-Lingulodinium_polyedra.AAC.1